MRIKTRWTLGLPLTSMVFVLLIALSAITYSEESSILEGAHVNERFFSTSPIFPGSDLIGSCFYCGAGFDATDAGGFDAFGDADAFGASTDGAADAFGASTDGAAGE